MSNHLPAAYTYDAALHCPACAIARFGTEPGRPWVSETATDSEGNTVGAVFPWDDSDPDGECCDTCGREVFAPFSDR